MLDVEFASVPMIAEGLTDMQIWESFAQQCRGEYKAFLLLLFGDVISELLLNQTVNENILVDGSIQTRNVLRSCSKDSSSLVYVSARPHTL